MTAITQSVRQEHGVPSRDGSIDVWQQHLLWVVDFALAGVIFFAPLLMGGRHPVGRLAFVGFACLAAVAWTIRQCVTKRAMWVWSGAEWLILAGLGVILFQLLPLPGSWLERLSPTTLELLPLWSEATDPAFRLGQWTQITLAPEATRSGLVLYLAYALLFVVTVQRIRSLSDIERLMRWIALAAVGMAALGLLQFLLSNGKFLWIYRHPSRSTFGVVKGTFANQNHFAHFLALGVGPLIWWLRDLFKSKSTQAESVSRHSRRIAPDRRTWSLSGRSGKTLTSLWREHGTQQQALSIGAGILAFACLLTFSRGGVIALSVAAGVSLAMYVWLSLIGRKSLFVVATMAVLVVAALSIHGYEPLARRLSTLRDSRSMTELSRGRHELWKAHSAAIPKFAVLGTGVGSHREVYPVYMQKHFNVEFTHAESGYLHLLLETGLLGLICALLGIALGWRWCLRALSGFRQRMSLSRYHACAAVILAALTSSVVHSFGDFVWCIPACMSLTVILLASAARLAQLYENELATSHSHADVPAPGCAGSRVSVGTFLPRRWWIAVAAVGVSITAAMLTIQLPEARAAVAWDRYLTVSLNHTTGDEAAAAEDITRMSEYLDQTLQRDPNHARANLRMAAILLRRFEAEQRVAENPMSLSQIRDAALASRFPSRGAQDRWLDVAVGENRKLLDRALHHVTHGLKLCPLQGEGYIYLTELWFLNSPQDGAKRDFIAQAEKVRPHRGIVLFAVGKEAALAGDVAKALEYWKNAFDQDPAVQAMIIESFASRVPANFFLAHFRPDLAGLERLYAHYRDIDRPSAQTVGKILAEALVQHAQTAEPADASNSWHRAQSVYSYLGLSKPAIHCEQQAVALTPHNFQKRKTLVKLLVRASQFGAAREHLNWCLRRSPDDAELMRIKIASKRHLLGQDHLPGVDRNNHLY